MGIPVLNLPSCTPTPHVGKWTGPWPVLVTAKGSLWGLQFSGSPRWPHLVELREISRLSNPATWILQSGWNQAHLLHQDRICLTIYFLEYFMFYFLFICFLLPFRKKNFSASQSSFLRIIPFPLWFKNTPRFLPAFETSFYKKPPICTHFHN